MPGPRGVCAVLDVRNNERLLTAAEVAERLGFTERYVWRLGREGVLPRIKLPGRKYVRFAEEDVEQFIAAARRQSWRVSEELCEVEATLMGVSRGVGLRSGS